MNKESRLQKIYQIIEESEFEKTILRNCAFTMSKLVGIVSFELWHKAFSKIDTTVLKDSIADIYDKNFTTEEIDQFLIHTKSPIFKKILSLQNNILSKATDIGKRWTDTTRKDLGLALKEICDKEICDKENIDYEDVEDLIDEIING